MANLINPITGNPITGNPLTSNKQIKDSNVVNPPDTIKINPITGEPITNTVNYGTFTSKASDVTLFNIPDLESFTSRGIAVNKNTVPFISEWRAEKQSIGDQWGNAAAKTLSLAVTTFAETFTDIFVGIPTAMSEGKISGIYDNAVSDEFKEWNSNMEKWFPNYYTKERADNPFYKNLFTANFWADKVLKNLGFTLGAIGGGMVTAGIGDVLLGLKGSTAIAQLANDVSKLGTAVAKEAKIAEYGIKGINTIDDLHKAASAIKFKQGLNKAISMYTAAQTESGIVAHQSMDDFKNNEIQAFVNKNGRNPNANELEIINNSATAVGNTNFALNLPLLMISNGLQFSKLFSRGYGLDKIKLNKIVTEETGEALENIANKSLLTTPLKATSTQLTDKIWNIGKRIASEGVYEEMGQYAIERGAADYYSHQLQGTDETNQLIKSIATGLQESYGTAAGWEQGVIGSIIGAMGMPGIQITKDGKVKVSMQGGVWEGIRENKQQEQNTKVAVDFLNRQTPELVKQFGELYKNAANHVSYSKQYNKAIEDGDHFIAENAKFDDFISLATVAINTGTFDILKDKITGIKDLDVDEFKKTFGVPEDIKVDASTIDSHITSLLNTMDEVQQIKEDLDTRFALAPNEFPLDDIKTIYLHNAIGIKNADKRIDELSSEYNKIMDKHKISIDMLNDKEDADIKNASESIDKLILNDKRTDEENKEFNNAVKKLELTDNDLRDLKQVKQNYEEIKTLDTKDFLDRVNEQYKDLQKIRKFSAIDHNKLLTIVNDLIRLREKRFNTVALHNYLDKNITSPKLEELLTNIKTAVHNRTTEAKKAVDKVIKDKELSKEREQLNLEMNDNSDFTALENKYPNLKQDIRKYKKDLDNRNKALDAEFINKIYNATTVEQLDELSKSTLGSKHIDKINIRKSQLKTSTSGLDTSKPTKTLDELITKINNSKKANEKAQVDYLTNEDIKLEDRLKRANVFDLGEGSNFSDDFKEFVKVWRELNTKEVSGEGVDKSKEGASSFSPTGDIESDQFITDVNPTQVAEKEPIAGINTFLSSVNQINIEEFDIIKTDVGIKIANSQLSEKFKKILSSDFNIGKPLYIKIDDEYIESKDENKDKELNLKIVDDEDTTLLHLNRNRYLKNELILTDELTKGLDKLDEDKFKIFREELNTLHTSDVLSPDGYKQFTTFVNKWFGKDSLLLIEDNISTLSDFNITNIIEKLYRRVDYTISQKLFDTKANLSVWKQIIEQDLTGTKRLRNEVVERLDKGEERDKISIKTKLINKTNGSIVTTQKYHKVSETVGEYNKDYRLAIIPSYSSKSDLKDLRDIETEKSFDDLGIVSELKAGLIYLILTNTPTSRPSLIPLQARTINDTELTQVLGYTNDIINLINKNKDNNSFTRANKSLTDIIDKLSKIIYVNKDTNSTNKQFKINTSVDKVGNIHAIEFTVKGKRYDIIISAKGNVGINSIVDGKSTMLTKPNTTELDNIMLSSILKDKLYNINFDNFKTFNPTSGKLEYDAKKATSLIKELIDNGDLLSNVGMVMDEKGNKISNFMPEGKRNMIITIGDEIKDNFEETSKVITKSPVGEKEDMLSPKSSSVFDDALNEIQQKGKTLLQKELTIEQNKKVSENVLKIVADRLSKRTNIPYSVVNYEDIKDKYEDVESTTKGFYAPGERAIYFIRGNFTLETAFHEFAHPIVDSILTKNRILFRDLSVELQSDKYKDSFAEVVKKYAFDYKFDTTVTQEQLNDYNVEDTFKFFNTLPKDIRIELLSEGITNAWGQESETWIDETTGKIKVNLAEVNPLVRLWQMIVDWFKEFIGTGKVEDIKPTTTIRELGQMLALGNNDIKIEDINRDAIKYTLKSIDILNSDKAKQIFEKGNKNNWSIDKILQELAIPKEQRMLVIDSYNEGNNTIDKLVLDIASKYGFSVEINTAKVKEGKEKMDDAQMRAAERGEDYFAERDFYDEFKGIERQEIPTQHYSNLTVPGGTNYTENEISTPLITPSIKGHAQFSTDKGIGWFRSDEQADVNDIKNKIEAEKEFKRIAEQEGYADTTLLNQINKQSKGSKTRRILEIQSDLFQKGRDKEILTGYKPEDLPFDTDEVPEYKGDIKANQFLQLLNKDNNWVTFFIKSIIQDTAKQTITEVQEEDVEFKVRELEREGLLEIDCSKVKAKDGIRSKFTKGSQWEIVKDLKGYPSHAQGGVDIKLGKNGFSFTRDNGVIEAKHGLVLPKIK